jgi:hypothetical protein
MSATTTTTCPDCGKTKLPNLVVCDDCGYRRAKEADTIPPEPQDQPQDPTSTSPSASSSLSPDPGPSSLVPSPLSQAGEEEEEEREVDELLRMYAEGRVELDVRPLPPQLRLSREAREVAEFFLLVCALRRWAGDDRPVLFSFRWAARHVGFPRMMVWRLVKQLETAHVMRYVDKMPRSRTFLYEPGPASYPFPAGALDVEADDGLPGSFQETEQVDQETAVREAVADDGREVLEPDRGLAASGDAAAGLHGSSVQRASGTGGGD